MQTKVMPKKVKPKLGKIREGTKKCLRPDLSTYITMLTLWHKDLFWLSFNPYSTLKEHQQAIKNYLKEYSDIKQLRGVGWDKIRHDSEARGLAPKELFDQVVLIYLLSLSQTC